MNMFGAELDNELVLAFRESPAEQATAAENRRILMDALEALAAGDADAFWSIFSSDVVFHEAACLPYGGEHRGLAATQQAFGQMTQLYSQMHAVIEAVSAARDIALLYQTISFRVRATGATGSLPVTEMYRFRDGKIVEWRALYFDADMVAGALAGRA
jgi:ketosteroid isomerase-like protein